MDVEAKGIEYPVTLCEVLGIGGQHRLNLPKGQQVGQRRRTPQSGTFGD